MSNELVSHGIYAADGSMFFVVADGFDVDGEGRLIFWQKVRGRCRTVAAVDAGRWTRVLRGVSLEDFQERGEDDGDHS